MKKSIYGAFAALIAAFALSSCEVDLGTEVGNDAGPRATIYQIAVSQDYDSDCDVALRVAVNNKTEEVYVFNEPVADKAARVEKDGEEAYCDYVVKNGKKITASVDTPAEIVVEKVYGEHAITVVAVNGAKKTASETIFAGLEWVDKATGTYTFANSWVKNAIGAASVPATLQYLKSSPDEYRFKNIFGKNSHLRFTVYPNQKSDDGYTFMRVLGQSTPLIAKNTTTNYGAISVRDVAAWQNKDDYAGWSNFGMEEGFIELWLQWYVSAGSLGYGCDVFEVD